MQHQDGAAHEIAARPDWVVVSHELTLVFAPDAAARAPMPADALAFLFELRADGPAILQIGGSNDAVAQGDASLRLLFARDAFVRFGGAPQDVAGRAFHLPFELRAMALALRACALPGEMGFFYRAAKAVELLCEIVRLLRADALTPLAADAGLSLADSRRLLAARHMIDERCGESLTLASIGRACGLNRAKLSRGFRSMFDCTVAEAIAARRLAQASQLLRTTDLPVSLIAYRSGYQNNASFTRAFGRHFGVPPTSYRGYGLAA